MQVRTKVLSAALAGACMVAQGATGAGVVYAGAPVEPVDMVPGTLIIDKLDLSKNTVTVTYTDTGTDVDKVTRLAMFYVSQWGERADLSNWQEALNTPNLHYLYNKATGEENAVELLSGQTVTVTDASMIGSLRNDSNSRVYAGVTTALEGNESVVRYATAIADYNKCMMVFTRGVECVRQETSTGKIVYAAYKDGSLIGSLEDYLDDEEEDNGGGENGGNGDSGGEDNGGEGGEGNEGGNGSENGGEGDGNGNGSENGGNEGGDGDGENSNKGGENGENQGGSKNEEESGKSGENESKNEDENKGASVDGNDEGSGESNSAADDDHWSGTSDPGNVANDAEATAIMATTGDVEAAWWGDGGYGGYGGYEEAIAAYNSSEASEEDRAKEDAASANEGTENMVELPDLGGGEEERGGFNWWTLGPVTVGLAGIAAWWLIPIAKKRKKAGENEEN